MKGREMFKLTKEQQKSLLIKWQVSDQGMTYLQFRRTVTFHSFGDFIGVLWCGMFVGIEKDGYAHT